MTPDKARTEPKPTAADMLTALNNHYKDGNKMDVRKLLADTYLIVDLVLDANPAIQSSLLSLGQKKGEVIGSYVLDILIRSTTDKDPAHKIHVQQSVQKNVWAMEMFGLDSRPDIIGAIDSLRTKYGLQKRVDVRTRPSAAEAKQQMPATEPAGLTEELKSQLAHVTGDNIALRSRNSMLEAQAADADAQAAKVKEVAAKLITDNIDLRAKNNAQEGQITNLNAEVARQNSINAGVITQNTDLKTKNGALEGQVATLSGQVDALNKANSTLNVGKSSLVQALQQAKIQSDGQLLQIRSDVQEISSLKTEKSALQTQVAGLQKDVDRLNQELQTMRSQAAQKSTSTEEIPEWAAEWIAGQQNFEKRWQAAIANSTLPPVSPKELKYNKDNYVFDRFKRGMGVIQEFLADRTISSMSSQTVATQLRAGIEYLIREIWPNDRVFETFFKPDVYSDELLGKIIYLPEDCRDSSIFKEDQKKDVKRTYRMLLGSLHPDKDKTIRGRDPQLQNVIGEFLKHVNDSWAVIEKLIK